MELNQVPRVSIRRDPRFTLEENWLIVEAAIKEAQGRGVLVTPLSVFDFGTLIGWYLHGWKVPPSVILYQGDLLDNE